MDGGDVIQNANGTGAKVQCPTCAKQFGVFIPDTTDGAIDKVVAAVSAQVAAHVAAEHKA